MKSALFRNETNNSLNKIVIAVICSAVLHAGIFAILISHTSIFRSESVSISAPQIVDVHYVQLMKVARRAPSSLEANPQPTKDVFSNDNSANAAQADVVNGAIKQVADNHVRDSYVVRLRAMIEKHKNYPVRARQLGLTGRVVIAFTILGDGRVTDVHVSKPCHHGLLNESAIELIANLENFEALPPQLGLSRWPMRVPIDFALNQ